LPFAVAGLDDASPVRVVTAASRHACCLRLGVFRPRPPARTEPIGQSGHYGRTRHDRPDPRTVSSDQAPLLRLGPLQRTSAVSRALRRRPAFGTSRFGVSRSPRPRIVANLGRRRVALAVFRCWRNRARHSSMRRTFGVGRSIVANVSRAPHIFVLRAPVTHSSIDRTRLPSSAIRRTGAVGVTDAHASRPDPLHRALPLAISSSEPGHAPTRPLARCSATRRSGCRTALPDEGSSLWSPSGGAPGVAPFAGLIPRAGGRAARVRRLNA
jgi:hypothetical protein